MRRAANRWHTPPGCYLAGSTVVGAGLMYMLPFLAERTMTIDALALYWLAHPTGGHVRVGIYADGPPDPTGAPLVDTGSIAANVTNGYQKFTLGTPLALPTLGKFWIGLLVANDITGTTPTLLAQTPTNDGTATPDVAGGIAGNCCFVSGLTTTLPTLSTVPTYSLTNTWPLVSYRVSSFV